MEIISETDRVIRTFLPVVLAAAGQNEAAQDLRDLDPIIDVQDVIEAAIRLHELKQFVETEDDIDPRWKFLVEDSLFWCEAALWSAVRKDIDSFNDHMHRVSSVMKDGLSIITFN